jgi:hypothetical protein
LATGSDVVLAPGEAFVDAFRSASEGYPNREYHARIIEADESENVSKELVSATLPELERRVFRGGVAGGPRFAAVGFRGPNVAAGDLRGPCVSADGVHFRRDLEPSVAQDFKE